MSLVRYRIKHRSHYFYQLRAYGSVMALCLQPWQNDKQKLTKLDISISPTAPLTVEQDNFGNHYHYFSIHRGHHEIEVVMDAEVELHNIEHFPAVLDAGSWKELESWHDTFECWDFLQPSHLTSAPDLLEGFIAKHGIATTDDPLGSLQQLNKKLYECLQYRPGSTTVDSTVEQILTTEQGVCQDYAHLMIAIARRWGIPARYVSGYLCTTGVAHEQATSDATHAWLECKLPRLGWVGFDPTNCSNNDTRHVCVAIGRDYSDVPPTRGMMQGGGNSQLEVQVTIQRL